MNTNTQNIAIITLCITAAILGGLLIGVSAEKAQGDQSLASYSADYIQVPYQLDTGTDLLVVIDARSHRMIAYKTNLALNQVEVVAQADLESIFKVDDK